MKRTVGCARAQLVETGKVRRCLWLALLACAFAGCSDDAAAPKASRADAATADAADVAGTTDTSGAGSDASQALDTVGAADQTDAAASSDSASATDAIAVTDAVEATDAAAQADAPAPVDTVPVDTVPVDTVPADTAIADAGCPPVETYSYTCDPAVPATCPGGACVFGVCIGPQLDPTRWDACGNGSCEACETGCPADCGPAFTAGSGKQYTGDKTITVWVHGFSNQGPDKLKQLTYGSDKGCGDVLGMIQQFGVARPCGTDAGKGKDPNQLIAVEYYGENPPGWMTQQEIAEVEQYPFSGGPLGLQRYALITAKFARYKMEQSGATHVQFACHSMGCLITRQLIETDLEGLASSGKIVRWFTSTGVVAGARLSRLFNNDTVQQASKTIGLELSDFILMNPDYVWDTTAVWDHKLHEANNPHFGGVLMHHVGATDPKIAQALNIQLLDLLGGGNEANDGIMYTDDMYFHDQAEQVAFKALSGEAVRPGLTLVHADHMTCPETEPTGVLATAALFHRRKVEIKLAKLELKNDLEKDNLLDFSQEGDAPAEVSVEVGVRFNPYIKDTFGKNVLVHDSRLAQRTAPLWQQTQGTTSQPGTVLFQGPVFDQMTSLNLQVAVVEVDNYPAKKILENIGDPSDDLVTWQGAVPLTDGHTWTATSANAVATFAVRVFEMYSAQ